MPSAFPCERRLEHDLRAIEEYGRYTRIDAKARALANRVRGELPGYFAQYWKNFQQPRKLLPKPRLKQFSSFLAGLYSSKSQPFAYIAHLRDNADIGACLYCGLPKNITLDHYLPRDVKAFFHLSFFSYNLVPACSSCQGSKSNFYPKPRPGRQRVAKAARRHRMLVIRSEAKGAEPASKRRYLEHRAARFQVAKKTKKHTFFDIKETRRIIHPYFDRFLGQPAFDIRLAWHKGIPSIEKFVWSPHLTGQQRALLLFHLKKLKVKERSRGVLQRTHQAFVEGVVELNLTQEQIKWQIAFMLGIARRAAKVENAIQTAYFRALLKDEAQHALLAAKSATGKPGLVSESKAVRIEKKRKYEAELYGL